MPSILVYLLSPRSIALMAAPLMLSGVSKSGSPAPNPMTLRPAALSARALSVTAMVAEGLMRLSESARKAMDISNRGGLPVGGRAFFGKVEFAFRQNSQQSQHAGGSPAGHGVPVDPRSINSRGRRCPR